MRGFIPALHPMPYSDAVSSPKIIKPIDWSRPATDWHETTIGKLLALNYSNTVSGTKKHEAAFFIKSNYPGMNNKTTCKVGACSTGMIIRIGEYEYRIQHRTIYRKLIG